MKIMNPTLGQAYLESVVKRMLTYKELGEKTFAQLEEKDLHFSPNESSNSIAVIIQHVSGNMLSRWTNFLTEDGEKSWRERDREFDPDPQFSTHEQLLGYWEQGWSCMLDTLRIPEGRRPAQNDPYPQRTADRRGRDQPATGPLPAPCGSNPVYREDR